MEDIEQTAVAPTYVGATYARRCILVPVMPEFATERSVVTALWPESRRGNLNVEAFLSPLHKAFPSTAPWDDVCFGAGPIGG